MERRSGCSELVTLVSSLIDEKSTLITRLKPYLSTYSYHVMLRQLAKSVSNTIVSFITAEDALFSEWGAMLLDQEVLGVVELLEQEAIEADISVRNSFLKLLWCMKVLTLDQPADVRRYTLPSDEESYLDDPMIRSIMSKRVEFSKDAVAKVKIGRNNEA